MREETEMTQTKNVKKQRPPTRLMTPEGGRRIGVGRKNMKKCLESSFRGSGRFLIIRDLSCLLEGLWPLGPLLLALLRRRAQSADLRAFGELALWIGLACQQ